MHVANGIDTHILRHARRGGVFPAAFAALFEQSKHHLKSSAPARPCKPDLGVAIRIRRLVKHTEMLPLGLAALILKMADQGCDHTARELMIDIAL